MLTCALGKTERCYMGQRINKDTDLKRSYGSTSSEVTLSLNRGDVVTSKAHYVTF